MKLTDILEHYEKNKISVIKSWISSNSVLEILKQHNIEKELFIRRYAFALLDYHLQAIKDPLNKNETLLLDFIKYLKKHDIKSYELYLIYAKFKEAFIKYLNEINQFKYEFVLEINSSFEDIFSFILEEFNKSVKQVKEALSKSSNIVDKNIIMSRTDTKGNIIKVSSAFCDITGYLNKELIGKPHSIIKSNDMPNDLFKDLWNCISSGKVWSGEIKNCKKNGENYWVETTIHPNFDNIGKIISYDAISQDITSKKELQSQQNILVEQSKSAAMGEMISMIAHQWRQPLQTVSVLIQKLSITKSLEGNLSDEVLDKVVNDITSQLNYMSKTIDDFRDYFKPNKKKESVQIDDVINKAIEFLDYMISIDDIKMDIKLQSININIYLNEIVQVLINILKNSRDAMIENKIKTRVIQITSKSDKEFAYIEVEDNAGGIPSDIIGKIFEPYFSTKSNKNGTGLGLYMCKTIVEQHSNGKLNVQNTEIGAKFTIALPLK